MGRVEASRIQAFSASGDLLLVSRYEKGLQCASYNCASLIAFPDDASIFIYFGNDAAQCLLERGDFISNPEVFELGKFLQSCGQDDLIDLGNASDKMGDERCKLLFSYCRDVSEESVTETTSQFCEGVSIKEKKWSQAMKPLQVLDDFEKR